jgi:hypothetical protein
LLTPLFLLFFLSRPALNATLLLRWQVAPRMAYAHALCGHEYELMEDFEKAVGNSTSESDHF